MKNHFLHLLREWNSQKHDREWVLGTVIRTSGSSYQKAGAFMLFNDLGQRYGLLSGGCLESDLHRKASFALLNNRAMVVR